MPPLEEVPRMPGVRDRNLRSGDLQEGLGIFLLKAVALVAPVPRPEDVGNDAFATLIRPEGTRRLIPDLSWRLTGLAALRGAGRDPGIPAREREVAEGG